MKRKRKRLPLVPRLGAPQNLRPAGAHDAKTIYDRKKRKAALRRYDEDGFFTGSRPRHDEAGNVVELLQLRANFSCKARNNCAFDVRAPQSG